MAELEGVYDAGTQASQLPVDDREARADGQGRELIDRVAAATGVMGPAVRRYSDNVLLALLKAHRPPGRQRSVRFKLPQLRSAADAASAMAAITAGVASGDVTPGEAAELSKLVEAYVKALEASEFDQRLRTVEERNDAA